MKQKDIAFQLGISEAYVTQLKKVIAFFLTRIRAILGPKTIKQPRKCPFYQHFRGSVRYSNSTNPNQFCLEIILCRIRGAFDYLIYPYYPAYMG
jgi:hypothetical protein